MIRKLLLRRLGARLVPLGAVLWIVVGLIIASRRDYLESLDSLSRILSAVLAVAVWPLVALGVHFGV